MSIVKPTNSECETCITDIATISEEDCVTANNHVRILEVVNTLGNLSTEETTVLLTEMVPKTSDLSGSDTTINVVTPITIVTSNLDQSGLHSLAEAVTLEQVLSETKDDNVESMYINQTTSTDLIIHDQNEHVVDCDNTLIKNEDLEISNTERKKNDLLSSNIENFQLPDEADKKSVGIQTNDQELDRRSGRIPSRRIVLPSRFRDFEDDDIVEGDMDYKPGDDIDNIQKLKRRKGPGRPRKYPPVKIGSDMQLSKETSEASNPETQTEEISLRIPIRRGKKTSGLNFRCNLCGKKFSQKGNLKTHLRTHTDERPFICQICQKGFKSKETLHRHQQAHSGVKPFLCEFCDQRFSSAVSLKEHQARHTNEKPYQCTVCSRFFRQTSCLRRHLITHSNSQPFSCNECGRSFSQMIYLRSHMRIHTGEKPFKCSVCNRCFSHQSDLNRHKVIHLGIKPYSCPVCQVRFSDPSSRRRHIKEHYGFKTFICQLCGDGFKRAGQLKAHLYKKHASELNEVTIIKTPNDNSLRFVFKCGIRYKTVQNIDQSFFDCDDIPVQPNNEIPDPGSDDLLTTVENESLQLSLREINDVNKDDSTSNKNLDAKLKADNDISENSNQLVDSVQVLKIPIDSYYILNPDFSSQEYYNWLSNFTTLCKLVPVPIEADLFTKISQVHKSLSDVLASPCGVVSIKDNFKILMSISKDLHGIISEHLSFVLDNLDGQTKQ